MSTSWKSQMGQGTFSLQFETTDYEKYKAVEKIAQKMVDKSKKQRDKAQLKEMSSMARTMGHV